MDVQLTNDLKAYRRQQAAKLGYSQLYYIFDNKTLLDLVEKKPTSRLQLLKCTGFGALRTNKYGKDVMEIIAEHTGVPPTKHHIPLPEPKSRGAEIWSDAEINALCEMIDALQTGKQIAAQLGRSLLGIHI